jgi:hypothetical protein
MARRLLAIAFVLAALAPEASALAQQSTQQASSHATTAAKSTTSSHTTATARHSMAPNARHGRYNPWANSVYVNGGSAAQYLATSTPKPPPGKNKVNNTGPEVFKSISN